MSTDDRFTQWDASYVLGALSPAERLEYEEHLGGCQQCRDAVAELAGLPGLLSRLPAEEAALMLQMEAGPAGAQPRPSPAEPLPSAAEPGPAVVEPGPSRRPTRWLLAAAAALVVGGLGGYALGQGQDEPAATPRAAMTSPARIAFSPVTPSAMTAVLDVVPTGSGTRLQVECQYASAAPGAAGRAYADYALVVVSRDGATQLAKTWTARPNVVMRPTADTSLALSDIAAVEIRAVDGDATLMRAELG